MKRGAAVGYLSYMYVFSSQRDVPLKRYCNTKNVAVARVPFKPVMSKLSPRFLEFKLSNEFKSVTFDIALKVVTKTAFCRLASLLKLTYV